MKEKGTQSLDEGRFIQIKQGSLTASSNGSGEPSIYAEALQTRETNHSIHPLFLKRWSPRAIDPRPVEKLHLYQLLEAARWAPSTFNEQEWRFLYTLRGSELWELFFDALADANKVWCKNAGALVCICGKKNLSKNDKENPVRSFDCGAAFQNMALQAAESGLVVHAMAGFNDQTIRKNLKIPDSFAVEAMLAIGYPGNSSLLPDELQEREKPSGRKTISEISSEGIFSFAE